MDVTSSLLITDLTNHNKPKALVSISLPLSHSKPLKIYSPPPFHRDCFQGLSPFIPPNLWKPYPSTAPFHPSECTKTSSGSARAPFSTSKRAAKAALMSPPTAYSPSNAASRRTRRASAPATSAASNSPTTAKSCLGFSSIPARANDPASPNRSFQAVLRIPSRRLLPPPTRRLENRKDPGATTYVRRLPALHSRHDCARYPRGSRTPDRDSGRGRVPRIQRFPAVIALLRVAARIVSFPRG